MPVVPRALEIQGEITAIRRDIHAHPELAYRGDAHRRTSSPPSCTEWGLEVTRGLGKTGRGRHPAQGQLAQAIGLRADMDCAADGRDQRLRRIARSTPGRMHACGHDGHTAMLLGAAKYLARRAISTARSTSSSSRPRKAAAAARR